MTTIKALLVGIIAIFAPIKAVMVTAMVLIFLDMFMGIAAAKKLKQPITSKGLSRTIAKVLVYEITIVCGFLVETYIISGAMPLVKIIGGLIGVTELVSILENADAISGSSLFKNVISYLQSQSDKISKD
jgi:phage-related holin